jgi:Fur family transcriptional regulator, ferric uptake regulator
MIGESMKRRAKGVRRPRPAEPAKLPKLAPVLAAKALREAGLRKTAPRLAVLDALEHAEAPLSHAEVAERLVGDGLDRVTVYRNLLALTDAGLVRRTDLGDHVWRFELVRPGDSGAHEAAHPHFVCSDCGAVSCLPDLRVRFAGAGADAVARKRLEVQLRGVCGECETPAVRGS